MSGDRIGVKKAFAKGLRKYARGSLAERLKPSQADRAKDVGKQAAGAVKAPFSAQDLHPAANSRAVDIDDVAADGVGQPRDQEGASEDMGSPQAPMDELDASHIPPELIKKLLAHVGAK